MNGTSRIAGNSVYDRSGQATVQTALLGAFEALLYARTAALGRTDSHKKSVELLTLFAV